MNAEPDAQREIMRFRQKSRVFYWAASVVMAVVVLFLALSLFVLAMRGHLMTALSLQRLALAWIPVAFYLWALWIALRLFAALSREGFVFHRTVVTALTRMGLALSLGAALSFVFSFILLFTGPDSAGGFAVFSAPSLTIGILGLTLIAIADLIQRAEDLRARNASLRATLDEFF